MKGTIIRGLYFWLLLFALLQPLTSYKDYLLDVIVKGTNAYIAEKAAPEGRVTSALEREAIEHLKAVGFREDEIRIEYEMTVKHRQQRIDVIMKADRVNPFVFDFSSKTGSNYYYAHNYVMSEYLD